MSSPTDSFQIKVEEAAKVMKITTDELWKHLTMLGIERGDDDAAQVLQHCSEKDARDVFVDHGKVKVARFSAGFNILLTSAFKEAKKEPTVLNDVVAALRPVTQWKDVELLEAYGPECNSDTAEELKRRANDRPVIIMDSEGKVNVQESVKLLQIARRRKTPSEFLVEGKLVRVCRIGEFPMTYIDECPLHQDIALADGFCEKCGANWSGVSEENMVRVRIATLCNFIEDPDQAAIYRLIEDLKNGKNMVVNNPKVNKEYDDMKAEDALPRLRRRLSSVKGKADPFFQHKEW